MFLIGILGLDYSFNLFSYSMGLIITKLSVEAQKGDLAPIDVFLKYKPKSHSKAFT